MNPATLSDISFDKEDSLLFSYNDDLLLKARAIQNSILPKLQVLLQESVSLVRKIYGIEVYDENSHVEYSPHFREKRDNDLQLNYDYALMGLTGSRKDIWSAFSRDDGIPIKIIPVALRYVLLEKGLLLYFSVDDSIKLSLESFRKLFSFLLENIDMIQALSLFFGFEICVGNDKQILCPFKDILQQILKSKSRKNYSFAIRKVYPLPLDGKKADFDSVIGDFCALFPLYYEFLQIAQGKKSKFSTLIKKLRTRVLEIARNSEHTTTEESAKSIISSSVITETANKKIDAITIRASIRWQVFERDDFRCVACGASALDGAILHVDHILPRSKGGADTMENYQTLCQTCNEGKSNRSERNLRERR